MTVFAQKVLYLGCFFYLTLFWAFSGVSLVLEPMLGGSEVIRFWVEVFGGILNDVFIVFDGVLPTPQRTQSPVVAGLLREICCFGREWLKDD